MKIKHIAMVSGLLLLSLRASAQQKEYKGKIDITPVQLEQKGDSLYVRIQYNLHGVQVDSRRSLSLTPALVSPDTELQLQAVMIKGANSYKAYQRKLSLMNKKELQAYKANAPYAVVKRSSSGDASHSIDYVQVLPYKTWMDNAWLQMQEDLCGCGNPPQTLTIGQLVKTVQREVIVEPYEVSIYLAYIRPEVEAVKRREMTHEAFLDFAVSQTDIRPDYMNNPRELKNISDMISEVKSDPNMTVRSITVVGYASPEGKSESNKKLSEGRASALVGYLIPRFDYPVSLYKVEFGGENWQGLKEKIEQSNLPYKVAVIDIIDKIPAEINYKNNTGRKKVLMDLDGGAPYRYMLQEIFPSLRKAICKIDYVVKGFEVEDAKQIIKKRPQDLSLNEMFLVANTYENGSPEFIDLFETAVRMYPDDQTANLNAASAALSRKDLAAAIGYLNKIKVKVRMPEYDNALGVLAMLQGDYDKAESYLNGAASAGLDVATTNLEELAKKRANIELMQKQTK